MVGPETTQNQVQQQPQMQQPVINVTVNAPTQQQGRYMTMTSDKEKKKALIFCLIGLLGVAGLHQFYVGRIGKGIVYLCTFGWFFIGTIIDLIAILTGSFKDNVGAPLRQ